MIDKETADKLKSKVATLKASANIVKIHEFAGQVIGMNVEQTSVEMGKYGEQLLLVGTIDGEPTRIYLSGKRRETFEASFDGAGDYAFVIGVSVELKSGNNYVPLELVEKL